MNEIQYIGENLLPRQMGHISVVLSFVSALLATISYFFATQKQNKGIDTEGGASWQRLGRWSFGIHSIAILTLIGTVFYVMIAKRFEYFYAHSHVDAELPFQYIFAAFWEGQEGSFMLWMFWHVGLGAFIILRGMKDWENPVIATLACVQVFLTSMVLGLHFGWALAASECVGRDKPISAWTGCGCSGCWNAGRSQRTWPFASSAARSALSATRRSRMVSSDGASFQP